MDHPRLKETIVSSVRQLAGPPRALDNNEKANEQTSFEAALGAEGIEDEGQAKASNSLNAVVVAQKLDKQSNHRPLEVSRQLLATLDQDALVLQDHLSTQGLNVGILNEIIGTDIVDGAAGEMAERSGGSKVVDDDSRNMILSPDGKPEGEESLTGVSTQVIFAPIQSPEQRSTSSMEPNRSEIQGKVAKLGSPSEMRSLAVSGSNEDSENLLSPPLVAKALSKVDTKKPQATVVRHETHFKAVPRQHQVTWPARSSPLATDRNAEVPAESLRANVTRPASHLQTLRSQSASSISAHVLRSRSNEISSSQHSVESTSSRPTEQLASLSVPSAQIFGRIQTELSHAPSAVQRSAADGSSFREAFSSPLRILELQLEPASLGLVKVRLSKQGEGLAIRIESKVRQTVALIEADKITLGKQLEVAGYTVDELLVQRTDVETTRSTGLHLIDRSEGGASHGVNAGQRGKDQGSGSEPGHGKTPLHGDRTREHVLDGDVEQVSEREVQTDPFTSSIYV